MLQESIVTFKSSCKTSTRTRHQRHKIYIPNYDHANLYVLCYACAMPNQHTSKKMKSFHKRAEPIVNTNDENRTVLQSISNANKKRACAFVKLCLDDEVKFDRLLRAVLPLTVLSFFSSNHIVCLCCFKTMCH